MRGLGLGVVLLVMLSGQAFPSGGGGAAVSTAGSGGDRQAVPRPVKRDVLYNGEFLKYGSGKVPEGRRIVRGVGTFRVRGGWLPVIHCSDL